MAFVQCTHIVKKEALSFYEVPLICGAAPEIGCGSRIKPLFIDVEKENSIKEAWTNREGTIIAVKWADEEAGNIIEDLFKKHGIDANYISSGTEQKALSSSLSKDNAKWLKGMDVDQLSIYEAGRISETLTNFAVEAKLITQEEQKKIGSEIEEYFEKDLVKVRSEKELTSKETQDEWRNQGFNIYKKHIGIERAEAVRKYFDENEISIMQKESCCSEEEKCCEKKISMIEKSTITCPYCGHKKLETLPTDVCQIRYTCEKCKKDIFPKTGDCCVYCSYGDHKCPSKQDES
jgi:hypothetical protein